MKLSYISIRRPVLASMMSLALVLFGLISLTQLPVRELPDIDPPIVSVTTVYPGANASVVETEVTERLEEVINNVEGIKTLTSSSREQVSNITVEFNLARDIDVAAQDVRDRVSRVRGRLPDEIEEPIVAKRDSDAWPVIWIGVSSERYTPVELSTLAEKQMKNRLQGVKGVSSVLIGGEQRYAIRLWLDAEKMAAHNVTVLDVARALRQQNVELPSGRVENIDREMTIQTLGEMKSAAEFNRMVILNEGTKLVRLRDIGEARDGIENERTLARNNGEPSIFLGVIKQSKANTVELAHLIREEVQHIRETLPEGVSMVFNYDQSEFVEKAIREVWITLGIAFSLVVIVIYVFLHNFRATLVPTVAIPVSLVSAFMVLNFLGYSINILTMLALVLAIGIVVDDTIVVLENIYRHIEEGMAPMEAAVQGMKEISFAVVATTVALVAVFVPLAFQKSDVGRLFVELAAAIIGAVVISTFVALTLAPMMSGRILRRVEKRPGSLVRWFEAGMHGLANRYERSLEWLFRRGATVRFLGVFATFATIIGISVILWDSLEGEYEPEQDKGMFIARVQSPEGATSEYTNRMLREMESIIEATPEVSIYGSIVAPGFSGPGVASEGIAFVHMKEDRDRSVQEIVNGPGGLRMKFFNQVEGAFAIPMIPKAIGRGFGAPFQLVIQSEDLVKLDQYVKHLVNRLNEAGFLLNVNSSFKFDKPELRLDIDRDRAAALGVSIEDISRTLQILFGGLDISHIKKDGKEYDVIAQLRRIDRLTPQDLDSLYVRNNQGDLIQLSSIVEREEGVAPNTIERYNRIRSATISGTPVGMPLGTAMGRAEQMLQADLPPGFLYDWSGESKNFRDANREFFWIAGLALVIVYMVLASQFESLIHPFTVILTVPLAGIGALGLLWLMSTLVETGVIPRIPAMTINLFSQIGFVLLVGLVTKNAILLVEFANQQQAKGHDPHRAMVISGKVRLRPILMTAISTMSGILPLAIGFGAGSESRRPMGIVVVGGMATSTFLTLFMIPVVYTVFSDMAAWWQRSRSSPPEALKGGEWAGSPAGK